MQISELREDINRNIDLKKNQKKKRSLSRKSEKRSIRSKSHCSDSRSISFISKSSKVKKSREKELSAARFRLDASLKVLPRGTQSFETITDDKIDRLELCKISRQEPQAHYSTVCDKRQ